MHLLYFVFALFCAICVNYCVALLGRMAPSGGDRSFASVAADNKKGTKLVLNTKLVQITKEGVERCK